MLPYLALVAILAFPPAVPAADFTVHVGHFEKNSAGQKGEASHLLFKTVDEFAKVFGALPPVGARRGNPVVAMGTFDKEMVAAVVRRGPAVVTYTEVCVKVDGDTATVRFTSEAGTPGTATLASPLVVSFPKGALTKVVFVENGKEVGTAW